MLVENIDRTDSLLVFEFFCLVGVQVLPAVRPVPEASIAVIITHTQPF